MEDFEYYSSVISCFVAKKCDDCPLKGKPNCIEVINAESEQRRMKSRTILQNEQQYDYLVYYTLESNSIVLNIANKYALRSILEILGITPNYCIVKYNIPKTTFYRLLNTYKITNNGGKMLFYRIIEGESKKFPPFDKYRLAEVNYYGEEV